MQPKSPTSPPETPPTAFTFHEWIYHRLKEVDPDVSVSSGVRGDQTIRLHGDWPIATVYGPPSDLMGAWLDVYPRDAQVEIFATLVSAINDWYGEETDFLTGLTVDPQIRLLKEQIIEASRELVSAPWATDKMRYVPRDLHGKLSNLINQLNKEME